MHETQDFRKEGGGGVIITVGVCGDVWGCFGMCGDCRGVFVRGVVWGCVGCVVGRCRDV